MPLLCTRMKYLPFEKRFVLKLYPPPNEQLESLPFEYRYRLISPVKQDDPLLRFIKSAILELEKELPVVAATGYKIQPLTWSPPIWPLAIWNARHPKKLYAIKVHYDEFPSSILVSIEDRGSMHGLTIDRVMVQPGLGKDRVPLKDYLLENAATALSTVRVQRLWWRKLDKPFRLMDLPSELRQNILFHVLGGQIRPHTYLVNGNDTVVLGSSQSNPAYVRKRQVLERQECHWKSYWEELEMLPYPNYSIFGVSKQIREEAFNAGWKGTEKCFYNLHYLQDVLSCTGVPSVERWLSKVTLVLNMTQLFDLFGLDPTPSPTPKAPHPAAILLAAHADIEELSIDFPNPHVLEQNPWHSGDHQPACYMELVDWVLTASFPYLRRIPTIRLRGAIKSATKRKWDMIFHIQYKKDMGIATACDHGFDFESALEDILVLPAAAMPPACTCPKPCQYLLHFPIASSLLLPKGKSRWDFKSGCDDIYHDTCERFDHGNEFSLEDFHKSLEDCWE